MNAIYAENFGGADPDDENEMVETSVIALLAY